MKGGLPIKWKEWIKLTPEQQKAYWEAYIEAYKKRLNAETNNRKGNKG